MKKRGIIKSIISYLLALIFAGIFGLYLNANVGWFILLTLILAPAISVFFAWLSSRMLVISCQMEDALLAKGDTCSMTVRVQNKSIFPTPPISVRLTNEAGVRSEHSKLLVSVLPRATQTFDVIFKSKICGESKVGIESVSVTDYLGLFSFGVKKADYASLKRKVAVLPDIAEISARDDSIMKVMQSSLHADDGEDTVESTVNYSFSGFPGYDNREYVPGDPLKRINWKQSAKRHKLLVRLDEELASKSVNVVLDSVFQKNQVDIYSSGILGQYRDYAEDEILPKIAEDAVENALGLMRILVRQNYTVSFYAMMDNHFVRYELENESDLEAVRLELAHYSFCQGDGVERIPKEDASFAERVGLFSTPNAYAEAYAALESETDISFTTIYSVQEEAAKQLPDDNMIFLQNFNEKKEEKQSVGHKIAAVLKPLVVPYLLALLLSVSMFSIFEVPMLSYWTLGQMLMGAGILFFCEYVKKHKVIGTMLIIVLIMCFLNLSMRMAFGGGYISYLHWFMSGGESVESTQTFLMTLLLIFTVFYTMVVYYYTVVRYKTSSLLFVSLIPFIVYVKVMQDINMTQVVGVTVLNVVTFLVNARTQQDKGKRIEGYVSGLLSLGLYISLLVMIGLAVPEAETKYYYVFENVFLGGNISEKVPEQYSDISEFSGNADGFNELNNRKLYEISSVDAGQILYLKRQTFDLYDFENDRWYPLDYYSEAVYSQERWREENSMSLALLLEALQSAENYEPGILAEYGLEDVPADISNTRKQMYVATMNFPSVAYITPPGSIKVTVQQNNDNAQENTQVTRAGVFRRTDDFLHANIVYKVDYYEDTALRNSWIAAGGADCDSDTSLEMLNRIKTILEEKGERTQANVVALYIAQAEEAGRYREVCEENTEAIPESVKELALEITKDCTYDWEKAKALERYFKENDFVYDLSYDAPDDSVEYFLFEGKTGTCSDYASAYVLMARSVGLTVRYVEGFVPEMEYNGEYVVRTNCGHAYPEVYIPNTGFVVFEATQPARYGTVGGMGSGISAYFMVAGFRILFLFAMVSAVIVALLFVSKIVTPYFRELYFLRKVNKAEPGHAVVMLYKRIQLRSTRNVIKNAGMNTPYEYAHAFETLTDYDISELSYMVERVAYEGGRLHDAEKAKAKEIYLGAKEAVKAWKKRGRGKTNKRG